MKPYSRVVAVVARVVAALVCAAAPTSAQGTADLVVEWNRIVTTALVAPGAHPASISVSRPYAMVHIAMFDALNSIDPQFTPYAIAVTATPGASREAAAAQAARDVAAWLMPTQVATFDAALAATLARLDPGAAAAGSAIGTAAAQAIIDKRANDSWTRGAPAYRLARLPGYWQPTPPSNQNATFVRYQNVLPFLITGPRTRTAEQPPALSSAQYAAGFNDVKSLGSATSTTRTAEQTQIARLWAGVGTRTTAHAAWNVAMQNLTRTLNLSGLEAARMFALANMAAHDALQVSYTNKFRYALWRPVTAIREAARDNNPDTEADPDWLPLVNTPANPTYPGNMACLGSSQARTLARLLGREDVAVTITWTSANGSTVSRSYAGLPQIADELARSRQYAGTNFDFDTKPSFGICAAVADYAVDNALRRR